jgi:hypothetical protein
MVIDIKGNRITAPAPIQLYPQKAAYIDVKVGNVIFPAVNEAAKNQLWTWVPAPNSLFVSEVFGGNLYFIQSVLDPSLVIEIAESNTAPGALLQVNTMKNIDDGDQASFTSAMNQLWFMSEDGYVVPG